MQPQTKIFSYLIKELAFKKALTYSFTGFLALASHGRISARFRVSKDEPNEQATEITITGNDKPPLMLKAHPVKATTEAKPEFIEAIQKDLDEVSAFLDKFV